MKQNGEKYRFWRVAFPLKWFIACTLIPNLLLAEPKPWYICTSKPYQLTFGSSMQCPNIEQKVKAELRRYLLWSYREYGRKQAMEAYRSFKCGWVEK